MVGMTASHRSRTAALALAAALIAGLAGCNSDPEPTSSTSTSTSTTSSTTTPSSSTSTSPSSTSANGPVKPEMPAEAKKRSENGAAAFTKFYWELVNYAYTKPDDSALPPYALSGCKGCVQFQNGVENLMKNRRHYSGRLVDVEHALHVFTDGQLVRIMTSIIKTDAQLLDAEGGVVTTQEREQQDWGFDLQWDGDSWTIQGLGR